MIDTWPSQSLVGSSSIPRKSSARRQVQLEEQESGRAHGCDEYVPGPFLILELILCEVYYYTATGTLARTHGHAATGGHARTAPSNETNRDTQNRHAINPPRIRSGERRVGACPVAVCANRLLSHGLSAGPEPNAMCRDDEVNGARKLGASSDFAP